VAARKQQAKNDWRRKRKMTDSIRGVWAALLFVFGRFQVQIPGRISPFVLEVSVFF
jgi:hypothetical protein